MKTNDVLKRLVYLDKGFIANFYEASFDVSPSTTITTNQGKKAGAGIFNFSAEVSAQETRSFSISTLEMLFKSLPKLSCEELLQTAGYSRNQLSKYGWISGSLSTLHVDRTVGHTKTASSDHFVLRMGDGQHLDFITTLEYFSSGFDSLLKLYDTLLDRFAIPVVAYVRLLPANDHKGNWIAVPFLVLEGESKDAFNHIG
ncbi:hypothetical protein GCM10027082_46740 [Comamonas humi]